MKELREIVDRIMSKQPPPAEPTPDELAQLDRETELKIWLETAPKIGVPRRLWGASFNAGLPNPGLARARQYVEGREAEDGGCLVLAGPTGVGKSYAAVAALRAWAGGDRRFLHCRELCGSLLDTPRRAEALDAAKRRRFVVLDDFGSEYEKPGGLYEAFVDEILCYREAEMLPTIITTNLTLADLKHRLSDRMVDRLWGGWGLGLEVPGRSLRSSAAAGASASSIFGETA